MKKTVIAGLAFTFMACSTQQVTTNNTSLKYPETKKGNVEYSHFGTTVKDPYRWLEDDLSSETKAWVEAQNKVTNAYLEKIPFREQIKNQMTELWNYEKIGSPFKEGNWTYFYKNDGLQQHSVLYRQKENGPVEVFLDPNTFSKDGTTSLAGLSFTKDGSRAAYSISEGGSDWRKIIVIDTETKRQVEDTLIDVKFSGISWQGNDGFYYSSYDKPEGESELSAKTSQHKLYFHQIGKPQSTDQLIFGGEITPRRYVSGSVTEDQRYLVVSAAETTTGGELYIRDLKNNQQDFTTILDNFDTTSYVIDTDGDILYLVTNLNAPNNRLVKTTIQNPHPSTWVDVISETDKVLSVSTAGGYFFVKYMKDVNDQVLQFSNAGELVREISLPGLGAVGGFSGKKEQDEIYYAFSNYIYPTTIFKYDVNSGQSDLYQKPQINFNPDEYESKQVFYTSADGTRVPMTITYKKGIQLDGKNPTILYAYGGFNISLRPGFSVVNATWLENGGIYAVANLRGGGEYGKVWHDGGRQLNKKNVFNDFIAAAEYLHKTGYTSPEYTAISGGSNGGLLVGAVQTMRPDLVKVALPAVGVLDMLRYHTFTAGAGWAYDYGTAEDNKEMFEYILSYSPVHNVKSNVCYPSTMVTTGDHDDRVVPAHSYKFAAELQDKQACDNPTLIRIETKAGHGAGKPTELIIEENTDKLSFALYEMGIRNLD